MRVTHVITGLGTGGAEMMLLKLIRSTTKLVSHQVVVLTDISGPVAQLIVECGVHVHQLNLKGTTRSLMAVPRISRYVRETQPDLVQGWMYHGNIAVSLASYYGGRSQWPVAWAIRCTIGAFKEKARTRSLVYGGIPLSYSTDAIFYNSEAARRQHEHLGYAQRGEVLPNGFDVTQFLPDLTARISVRNAHGIPHERFVVGYIGRFKPIKGLPTLFEAFAKAAKRNSNLMFVAAGSGLPDVPSHLRTSSEDIASLGDRLLLLPEHGNISSLYQAFDILVLTSLAEGFPNVIGEAMSSGVPCIATEVGACADIIGNTGFLVPVGASDAIADAIIAVSNMSDAARRELSSRSRARIVENFSIDRVAEQHIAAWSRLIRHKRQAG